MNEPICLARVRKDTKIELKKGDWIVLTSPDGTFSEANGAFEKVNGNVNEEFSRVIIGKVQQIAAGARDRSIKIQEEKNKEQAKAHLTEHQRANEVAAQIRKATGYKSN